MKLVNNVNLAEVPMNIRQMAKLENEMKKSMKELNHEVNLMSLKQNRHLIQTVNLDQVMTLNNKANYLINNKEHHMKKTKPRYNDEDFGSKHINARFGRHLIEEESPVIKGTKSFNMKKGSVEPTSMKTKLVSMLHSRRLSLNNSKVRLPSIESPHTRNLKIGQTSFKGKKIKIKQMSISKAFKQIEKKNEQLANTIDGPKLGTLI